MNLILDQKIILNIASNLDIFRQGEKLFKEGYVIEFENEHIGNIFLIKSKVFDHKSYYQNLKFDSKGNFFYQNCTCNADTIWRGACKHVVASLFKLYKDIFLFNLQEENNLNTKHLLEVFEERIFDEIIEEKEFLEDKVSIFPKIMLMSEVSLSLQVGYINKRQYIVKDISEFLNNVKNENLFCYGKELSFYHKLNNFDDKSKRILSIVKKIYSSFENTTNYNERILTISKSYLDSFFELFDFVQTEDKNGFTKEYKFEKNDHDFINFKFSFKDEEISLEFEQKPTYTFFGENFVYFVIDKIYRLENKKGILLANILKELDNSSINKLIFKSDRIYLFIYLILPELILYNFISKSEETRILEYVNYINRFYFSVEKKKIICKPCIVYDDKNYFFDDQTENKIINMIKDIIKKILFNYNFSKLEKNIFQIDNNDDIYYFFKFGIKKLENLGQIYGTEEFKRQSYIPTNYLIRFNLKENLNLLELSIESDQYQLEDLIETLKYYKTEKFIRLKNGKFVELFSKNIIDCNNILENLNIDKKDLINNTFLLEKYKLFSLEENKMIKIDESLKNLKNNIINFDESNIIVPIELNNILRSYQIKGYKWLKTLSHYGFGGILADDMGLGKTLQIISLILSLKEEKIKKQSLVVCPTSLIYNWAGEIDKFAEKLNYKIIIGSPSKRALILDDNDVDVLITNYDCLKRDVENYKNKHFKYIIADEAQFLKNYKTENSKAIKSLNSEVNFALTGTPIENNISELWSIFDFIMPGYLNKHSSFISKYNNIVSDKNNEENENLKKQLKPFILRRVKKDVLKELPDKIESIFYSNMTEEQSKIYNAYLLEARGELNIIKNNNEINKNHIKILSLITRLRQICCDPSLFIENYKGGSGKFDSALELIKDSIEGGHRILFFSQFTKMLNILIKKLKKDKISFFYIDGTVSSKNRIEMVDSFNNGVNDIFLISLKAGGAGLNLTGADVVIHFDPWWNYSVMAQATDRAHRIGQEKVVQVINVIAKNTIEEKIILLQEKKKELFENVIEEGSIFINKMSEDELLDLFNQK